MSDTYGTPSPSGSDGGTPDPSGTVAAVTQEAADLKDTATDQAKDVLGTAKDEASTVIGEAKFQAKDLYAQTQRELKDQADTQQQRIAVGLKAVSDELGSMAADSGGSGLAGDIVQQVSTRLSSAATWLGDRDSSSMLTEVKHFARRRPGTFILGAAVAGIVVGRLARALASNASDDKAATDAPALPPAPAPALIEPDPWATTRVSAQDAGASAHDFASSAHTSAPDGIDGAPLYAQTASGRSDILGEDDDDRPHAV